jgi:hypothetical protein
MNPILGKRRRTPRSQQDVSPKRRRTDSTLSSSIAPIESQDPSSTRVASQASRANTSQASTRTEKTIDAKYSFPFMKLPAELRLHVYHMALYRGEPMLLHIPRSHTNTDEEQPPNPETQNNTAPTVRRSRQSRTRVSVPAGSRPASDRTRLDATEKTMVQNPKDPITPALLRTCSLIYKEARQVLYSENTFILQLDSGVDTLARLHQRSRSLIKNVHLTVPSHHDILDGFADLIRVGLRYCWGLKHLTIVLPMNFPDERYMAGTTNIYANAFHILRWLPQTCKVNVEGGVNPTIRKVVEDEGRLMNVLDEVSHFRRLDRSPSKR